MMCRSYTARAIAQLSGVSRKLLPTRSACLLAFTITRIYGFTVTSLRSFLDGCDRELRCAGRKDEMPSRRSLAIGAPSVLTRLYQPERSESTCAASKTSVLSVVNSGPASMIA